MKTLIFMRGDGVLNKQAISNALKALQKTVKKHSPEILTGIGIAGMTAAAEIGRASCRERV